ncbi:unnamed protein product [marine sediment metagenome]|uniref:FCP1 homology domain-containing protein n=1 Tax=marine sediment metagenome TaxID=412755 RepID=X0W786_9ZZZZ
MDRTKNKLNYLIFDLDRILYNTDFSFKITQEQGIEKINLNKLVYPGVFEALARWQKKNYFLILFSEGDIKGQLFKLKFSGLGKFFSKDKRFIFENKKEKELPKILKKIPKEAKVWLFDDKPSKLKSAKDINRKIKVVLVCHGPWWKTKIPGFKPDYKIKNLKELEGIL